MRTPDGTEIFSRHRHDYVTHVDKNGETYMVDGGTAYLRRSVSVDAEDLSQYWIEDDHQHNRQHLHWGTRGPDGREALTWVPLMKMSTDHIKAIITDNMNGRQPLAAHYEESFKQELEYRASIT
jgi:hypothetical protein